MSLNTQNNQTYNQTQPNKPNTNTHNQSSKTAEIIKQWSTTIQTHTPKGELASQAWPAPTPLGCAFDYLLILV